MSVSFNFSKQHQNFTGMSFKQKIKNEENLLHKSIKKQLKLSCHIINELLKKYESKKYNEFI